MTRDELIALRNAIDATLPLPDPVRVMLARWLLPEPAQKPGNGVDPHPPPVAPAAAASEPERLPSSRPTKARRAKPAKANAGERKLLAAMESSPGASANALAKAAGMSRSSTGERLRRLSASGAIEKDAAGVWRIAGDGPRPTPPPG